jgi:hypothetical protein
VHLQEAKEAELEEAHKEIDRVRQLKVAVNFRVCHHPDHGRVPALEEQNDGLRWQVVKAEMRAHSGRSQAVSVTEGPQGHRAGGGGDPCCCVCCQGLPDGWRVDRWDTWDRWGRWDSAVSWDNCIVSGRHHAMWSTFV